MASSSPLGAAPSGAPSPRAGIRPPTRQESVSALRSIVKSSNRSNWKALAGPPVEQPRGWLNFKLDPLRNDGANTTVFQIKNDIYVRESGMVATKGGAKMAENWYHVGPAPLF